MGLKGIQRWTGMWGKKDNRRVIRNTDGQQDVRASGQSGDPFFWVSEKEGRFPSTSLQPGCRGWQDSREGVCDSADVGGVREEG